MVERRTKALLVEDDPNIVDLVRSNLTVRGYDTCLSPDGSRALQLLETERPDIVLLDLMFPDADGFELCRQMRERSLVGIIVVSARGGQHDKVAALNYGADDYLTKPFGIEELMARITATLRRTRPAEPVEASALRIEVGDLVVDLEMSLVTKGGEIVHLTPTEFALLRELAVNRGKLLTHAQLLGGSGARVTPPKPSTSGFTYAVSGPNWKAAEALRLSSLNLGPVTASRRTKSMTNGQQVLSRSLRRPTLKGLERSGGPRAPVCQRRVRSFRAVGRTGRSKPRRGPRRARCRCGRERCRQNNSCRMRGRRYRPELGAHLPGWPSLPPRLRAANRRGIAIVRQHTELCDNLDIAANLFLGREGGHFFFDQTVPARSRRAKWSSDGRSPFLTCRPRWARFLEACASC